jgi:DNA-binding CsgD family transcriptional regulator
MSEKQDCGTVCTVLLDFIKGMKFLHSATHTPHTFQPINRELTPREKDVLKLKASGLSSARIGRALFISEQTVKNHLINVYRKLNLHTCDNPEARACYLYGVASATLSFPKVIEQYERQKEVAKAQNLRADDI